MSNDRITGLTAEIVSAYVSKNSLQVEMLTDLIHAVHKSLTDLSGDRAHQSGRPLKPAVSVQRSVHDDYIVCLEDGKKFKTLRRHLNEIHGLTPLEYCRKWELPFDYPMMAPNYAAARSAFAKEKRLGYKKVPPTPEVPARKKVNGRA